MLWHLPMGPTQHTNNSQGERRRIPRVVSITKFAEPYHCHPRCLGWTTKGKKTMPLRLQCTKTPPQNQNPPPVTYRGGRAKDMGLLCGVCLY